VPGRHWPILEDHGSSSSGHILHHRIQKRGRRSISLLSSNPKPGDSRAIIMVLHQPSRSNTRFQGGSRY
jgi:hypothetical protein